jgi:hypothetical protein
MHSPIDVRIHDPVGMVRSLVFTELAICPCSRCPSSTGPNWLSDPI